VYAHQFNCLASGLDATGREVVFGGTDDGWVMQIDVGGSFDGVAIESILRLPFFNARRPGYRKRFYKLRFELTRRADHAAGLHRVQLRRRRPGPIPRTLSCRRRVASGIERCGRTSTGTPQSSPFPRSTRSGVGENIGLLIRHEDDIDLGYTLQAVAYPIRHLGTHPMSNRFFTFAARLFPNTVAKSNVNSIIDGLVSGLDKPCRTS
jgi:hypothetical protein